MNPKLFRITTLIIAFSLVFFSCTDKCSDTIKVVERTTIFTSLVDIRASFDVQAPKEIKKPGKLYVFGDVLFVVDEYTGFHVIDNSNKSAPVRTQFIQLDGCTDLVVKGAYIYANSANDLVTIQMQTGSFLLVDRNINVFNLFETKSDSVAANYIDQEKWVTSEEYNCEGGSFRFGIQDDDVLNVVEQGTTSGTGGSTARMTVVNNYIYAVDNQNLLAIDVSNGADPKKASIKDISSWTNATIETIFPMGDYLFIGTTTGMQIFNHKANPNSPIHESTSEHFRSCDPVVVQNDIAYVTTHGGSGCGGARNALYVYDVKDVKNPKLLAGYDMTYPLGLGIDGNTLFVCEDDFGLKVYDVTNPEEITSNKLSEITAISPMDVIPLDDVLIVTAKDGVYQYDYSDPSALTLLSKIYDIVRD
ncbi:MAG: hypothetical protein ACI9JN_000093 [Bacteroidia bacterium]|jgi:hypothetical protein